MLRDLRELYVYHVIMSLGQVLRPYWRLGLVGATRSIPRRGPLILAANHQSFLDPWFLALVFYPRPVRFLINQRWYNRSPVWREFFRAQGTLPSRDDPRTTIRVLCHALDRGKVVGIFPEGRISHDGRIQRFRPGISRVAAMSGVPVIPLGIRGAYDSIPRTQRMPRPHRVKIHVGEPMVFDDSPWEKPPPRRLTVDFSERVFQQICQLADQEDRIAALAEPQPG